jgi:hypothetical protein
VWGLDLLCPYIFLSTVFSNTLTVLPLIWETKWQTHAK